jgi:predicted HicB family RNase H-like nuclease
MKPTDRYLKIVEWSEEDGCYIGTCPGVIHGGIHGDDETKVYQELCQVVAEAVELYQADGKPLPPATANKEFSGRFVLRVDKQLHRRLAINAMRAGESLNSYCRRLLARETEGGGGP